jgi:hypothetical protein
LIFALGHSVLENHHTVFTASFALIFLLFTHSIGLGNFEGLYQKNSSARKKPNSSQTFNGTLKL